MAYESGWIDEPYDYSLNLLNLHDETSLLITNLISPDFPNNIEPIIETISQYDEALYGSECYKDLKCLRSLVQDDVLFAAGSFAWSPDSQFFAFSAQTDGPSSDIYLYGLQDKTIQRLTDDLQNTIRMKWSPDGRWLLYVNNIPGTSVIGETFHVTDLNGNIFPVSLPTLPPFEAHWMQIGWMSNNLYVFQALYHEHPQFRQLLLMNTENGQVTEIWPYNLKDFKIDTNNQTIVLLFESENEPNLPPSGVYRVSTNGYYQKISGQMFYRLTGSSQIIGEGLKEGVETAYHITSDNSIAPIGPAISAHSDVSVSPDEKWFFIDDFYKGDQRFTLYSNTYQPVNSWMFDEYLEDMSWRPDSLGVFLFTEKNIYYMDIPNGEPKRLDVEVPPKTENCDPVTCTWARFIWLP